MKKVIELTILPEDQDSGVTAISLVDRPAIEVNFVYFKKQEMVEPLPTESQDDFMPLFNSLASVCSYLGKSSSSLS